ncbi:MAG: FecR domain-containing protein [Prolixibacteraceae bacterium]
MNRCRDASASYCVQREAERMDLETIYNYLKQKAGTPDRRHIKEWLTDPENELQVRGMLGSVWADNRISLKEGSPDFDRMLGQVHRRINMGKKESALFHGAQGKRQVPLFYRVAAILLLPLLIASTILFVSVYQKGTQGKFAEKELITKPGTRVKIQLADGTTVWLNDGTLIRYPEKFAKHERHVFIDGEAYFEVVSDPEKPFIVENPMINTVVTGTSFNLRAYSSDRYFEATLSEGAIRLEKDDRQIIMKPGEQIQYNVPDNEIVSRKVNPAIYFSWINGKLILKDEPFRMAMLKLSRWYNAEIVIQDPELNKFLLTATLEGEKIEQTLEHIAFALPVKYRIQKMPERETTKTTIYMMKK